MHTSNKRLVLVTALAALVLGPACKKRPHHDDHPLLVFGETERNDFVDEADYFGTLLPGDRFVIRGHISDDGFDDFDGFAFTAGRALHVEFHLYADHPAADLDICAYDPQIDEEVVCYLTPDHPESGAVDVLSGGLDFHLVVESFVGSSTYSLEVEVFGLYGAAAEGGATQAGAEPLEEGARIVAAATADGRERPDADAGTFRAYGRGPHPVSDDPDEPTTIGWLLIVEEDPETGALRDAIYGVGADGRPSPAPR